jgi:RNA-directed DNA polymerase
MPDEVAARNTGDPRASRDGVHACGKERWPKNRALGSQSVHKSASNAVGKRAGNARGGAKAGNDRWSKGTQKDGGEMKRDAEQSPATVASGPKQAGETLRQKWHWVEPSVWTDRMLAALENGVKGNQWFSLMDKVESARNLRSAFHRVWRNEGKPGVDGQTVEGFAEHLEVEVLELSRELHEGGFRAQPVRRVYIAKPGSQEKRPLGIPAVRDRVVQGALRNVIEPIFEREFAEHSYGFRPGRSCHDALRRVEGLLEGGSTWVLEVDLKSYFDTIPHEALLARVRERISDGRVLGLIENFLHAGVLEELKGWKPTEEGTPQGAVISPLLANLYLNPLDHLMARAGQEMVRYADDFVILCRSQAEAQEALEQVRRWVEGAGLTVHPEKTQILDATQKGGFDFLGYHFERGMKWPRAKSLKKLKDKIRRETKRTNGRCMGATIARINPILRGWFGYFGYAKRTAFERLDGWIRGRLRSILRKRHKGKGRGRGWDHQRWPNAYFEQQGLYSLVAAQPLFRQSRV